MTAEQLDGYTVRVTVAGLGSVLVAGVYERGRRGEAIPRIRVLVDSRAPAAVEFDR